MSIADRLTERLPLRVMLDCLGVRPGSPDPRRAKAAELLRGEGWDALTPTEVKIAYLIGDGRSNPDVAASLYMSRNTVQTHVEIVREVLRQGVAG